MKQKIIYSLLFIVIFVAGAISSQLLTASIYKDNLRVMMDPFIEMHIQQDVKELSYHIIYSDILKESGLKELNKYSKNRVKLLLSNIRSYRVESKYWKSRKIHAIEDGERFLAE